MRLCSVRLMQARWEQSGFAKLGRDLVVGVRLRVCFLSPSLLFSLSCTSTIAHGRSRSYEQTLTASVRAAASRKLPRRASCRSSSPHLEGCGGARRACWHVHVEESLLAEDAALEQGRGQRFRWWNHEHQPRLARRSVGQGITITIGAIGGRRGTLAARRGAVCGFIVGQRPLAAEEGRRCCPGLRVTGVGREHTHDSRGIPFLTEQPSDLCRSKQLLFQSSREHQDVKRSRNPTLRHVPWHTYGP